jgi:hypothetical protein
MAWNSIDSSYIIFLLDRSDQWSFVNNVNNFLDIVLWSDSKYIVHRSYNLFRARSVGANKLLDWLCQLQGTSLRFGSSSLQCKQWPNLLIDWACSCNWIMSMIHRSINESIHRFFDEFNRSIDQWILNPEFSIDRSMDPSIDYLMNLVDQSIHIES